MCTCMWLCARETERETKHGVGRLVLMCVSVYDGNRKEEKGSLGGAQTDGTCALTHVVCEIFS